jgi:elongation factor G
MSDRPLTLPLHVTIEPTTNADAEKLGQGLQTLMAEDPTFRVDTDPQTRQTIIRGTGELHLEIIINRLRRELSAEVSFGTPQVACKETLTRAADGEMKMAFRIAGTMAFRMRRSRPGRSCSSR